MSSLTEEEALKRSRAPSLASMRNLNCWGCGFTDVSVLEAAESLEVLNLSCNKLTSLQALSNCPNLRELFLRKNQLTEFSHLQPLQQLKSLKVLWLSGNPVEEQANYRATVIQLLPQLVCLDDSVVTEEERREAQNSTTHHHRQQQGQGREGGKEGNILRAVLCLLPELSNQELAVVRDTAAKTMLRHEH